MNFYRTIALNDHKNNRNLYFILIKAIIASNGRLTESYQYIQELRDANK